MKVTKAKALALVGAVAITTATNAAPSVEITNVQQQYPWTNTVDITYTVAGVKDFPAKTDEGAYASNETYFVTFTATDADGKTPIPDVDGNTVFTNGLVNGATTETAQWQPALNLQKTGLKMTPSVFRGEDDAYMIVNLETNALGKFDVYFEPMSSQEASNKRYNTDEYKTRKLVLRRVRAGKHPIGSSVRLTNSNGGFSYTTANTVHMPKDYYIGIFELTRGQYARITGSSASVSNPTTPQIGNSTFATLRGHTSSAGSVSEVSFFGTLAGKAGAGFDLPTDAMWEVAARAGDASAYPGGNTAAKLREYAWCYEDTNGNIRPVGGKKPNGWGLYDVSGNAWEWILDTYNTSINTLQLANGQVPVSTGSNTQTYFRSSSVNKGLTGEVAFFSYSGRHVWPKNSTFGTAGFRVAFIAP